MSEQHTTEPWAIDPDDRPNMQWNNHIVSEANQDIAICFMAHDGTEDNECGEANARRIVACVNACAGYATEELEQATLDKRHRHEIIADLVKSNKQRDELLAALEEITNVFATIGITAGCYDDELNALQKGLSAIASVKANTQ